jgi:hypothetical protein
MLLLTAKNADPSLCHLSPSGACRHRPLSMEVFAAMHSSARRVKLPCKDLDVTLFAMLRCWVAQIAGIRTGLADGGERCT